MVAQVEEVELDADPTVVTCLRLLEPFQVRVEVSCV